MRDKLKALRGRLTACDLSGVSTSDIIKGLDEILSGPDLESRVAQLESQIFEIKKDSIKPGDKATIIKQSHLNDGQLILNNGRYFRLSRCPICEGMETTTKSQKRKPICVSCREECYTESKEVCLDFKIERRR